jgi:hypothetical protein
MQDDLTDEERRLLCAVLLQAFRDARKNGGPSTRKWLATNGARLLDDLDIAHPSRVRRWAKDPAPLPKLSEL